MNDLKDPEKGGGVLEPPAAYADKLHWLFYTTQQVGDFFASDDVNGNVSDPLDLGRRRLQGDGQRSRARTPAIHERAVRQRRLPLPAEPDLRKRERRRWRPQHHSQAHVPPWSPCRRGPLQALRADRPNAGHARRRDRPRGTGRVARLLPLCRPDRARREAVRRDLRSRFLRPGHGCRSRGPEPRRPSRGCRRHAEPHELGVRELRADERDGSREGGDPRRGRGLLGSGLDRRLRRRLGRRHQRRAGETSTST